MNNNPATFENAASLSPSNVSRSFSVGDCILLNNGEAGRLVALGSDANGAFAQVVMFESTPNKKEVLELEGQLPICCPLTQILSKVSIVKARSAHAAHKLLSENNELVGSSWLFCSGFKSRSGAVMPYSFNELDMNTSEDEEEEEEEERIVSEGEEDDDHSASKRPATGRACVECGATQTPQWREGPAGPKTLCNACGVRFNRLRAKGGGSELSFKKLPKSSTAATKKKRAQPFAAVPSRPHTKKTPAPHCSSFAPLKVVEDDVTLPHSSTSSQDLLDLSLGPELSILAPCPMRGVLRGATLKAFGFLSNVSSPKAASAVAGGGPSSQFELCTSPSHPNAYPNAHPNAMQQQGGISRILSEELAEALSNIERLEAAGKLQLPESALERIKDVTEQVNAATNEADAADEALRSTTLALMQHQRVAEEARERASAAVDRLRGFMSTLINEHRIVTTPLASTKGVIQVPSLDYYGAASAPVADPMAASTHAAGVNEAVSEAKDPDLLLSCWSGFGRTNALPSVQLDQDLLMFDGCCPFGGAADGSGATLLLEDGSNFGQIINAQA